MKRIIFILCSIFFLITLVGCNTPAEPEITDSNNTIEVTETEAKNLLNGVVVYYGKPYNQAEEVALYIVSYQTLPINFYLKDEYYKADPYTKDNLNSRGGDVFYNREGLLPKDNNYFECDINYQGGSRGAERLVFSLKTLDVYYTEDHYASFTLLYDDAIYVGGNYA